MFTTIENTIFGIEDIRTAAMQRGRAFLTNAVLCSSVDPGDFDELREMSARLEAMTKEEIVGAVISKIIMLNKVDMRGDCCLFWITETGDYRIECEFYKKGEEDEMPSLFG